MTLHLSLATLVNVYKNQRFREDLKSKEKVNGLILLGEGVILIFIGTHSN